MAIPFTATTSLTTTTQLLFSSKNFPLPRTLTSLTQTRPGLHVCHARRGLSSRKQDNRGRKNVATEEQVAEGGGGAAAEGGGELGFEVSTTPPPVLPGEARDLWEGPQWDAFGFVVEYLWAFGILFALIACGIAVATYNEGATDFKQTTAYKEAIQSQELLEEPGAANSDMFEGNPTEDAPSID